MDEKLIRLEDRFYGLVIGGALGDSGAYATASMLALCHALLDDADSIDYYRRVIWGGQYTATGTPLRCPDTDTRNTCCGTQSNAHEHSAFPVLRAAAAAMYHFDSYPNLLLDAHGTSLRTHPCLLCADASKLFASMLDSALHGRLKGEILAPVYYANLQLSAELWCIYDASAVCNTEPVQTLQKVCACFKKSNNFLEGLKLVRAYSVGSDAAAILYGQLAGAYYGLTDIPEDLMEEVTGGDMLLDVADKFLQRVDKTSAMN